MAAARSSSSLLPALLQLLLAALICLFSIPAAAAEGARATAVIVFGDSTVDAGNNNFWPTTAKGNFPPYGRDFPGGRATGRFSNGRVSPDFYPAALGLGRDFVPAYLDPSYSIQDFATGVNFASAGSGMDDTTSIALVSPITTRLQPLAVITFFFVQAAQLFYGAVFVPNMCVYIYPQNVITLSKQLDLFRQYKSRLAQQLGADEAEKVLNGAVYVISIGSNDFAANYFAMTSPGRHVEYPTVQLYTAYLVGLAQRFIADIHALGARKIGFEELFPLGCLPAERAALLGLCNEVPNAAARGFNDAMRAMVQGLNLPGADVRVAELYGFMDALLHNPTQYGFERADLACCGTAGLGCIPYGPACPDAGKYVYWDNAHTTDRAHGAIAAYLFNNTFGAFASA
ncbi:hypothetical protein EJB05_12175, partial [Eragrostis curvula]